MKRINRGKVGEFLWDTNCMFDECLMVVLCEIPILQASDAVDFLAWLGYPYVRADRNTKNYHKPGLSCPVLY